MLRVGWHSTCVPCICAQSIHIKARREVFFDSQCHQHWWDVACTLEPLGPSNPVHFKFSNPGPGSPRAAPCATAGAVMTHCRSSRLAVQALESFGDTMAMTKAMTVGDTVLARKVPIVERRQSPPARGPTICSTRIDRAKLDCTSV